jgi:hypothetical protein
MGIAELVLVMLVVAASVSLLVWRARRNLTLFVIRVDRGRIDYVKGRIPRRLLTDVVDVAATEKVGSWIVTCRIESGEARLSFQGVPDGGREQVLRNLVGQYPVARLKQAPQFARRA